ncbi:hypothetical protein [Bdellovibrio sp. BCCA]|uniref:hypothetical protein n=1 Tax=Bdellovibrio sp. BCCA TaxID=3136281 RepID=UPI0030F2E19F
MKLSLLLVVTLFTVVCGAAPAGKKSSAPATSAPELSLKEKALAESKIDERQEKAAASDAQVSGMLTLKDPRPEVVTRPWKYFAAFSGQMFQAEGTATKQGSGTFDLSKNDSTVMPSLELGVMSVPFQTKAVLWKFGVRGKAGFASQSVDATLASGYKIDDARLNTTMFSVGPMIAVSWERLAWLSFTLSPQYGTLSYTQTSSDDFAAFSKSAGFHAMGYGLDFAISNKWSLFTEWSQRNLNDSSEIALQKDNFELGTKVTW